MTADLSGMYLATDSTAILWLHDRPQKRANGNAHLIQFPHPENQFFFRLFWVAGEVDAKVMFSKPFQYYLDIGNVTPGLFQTFRPGRICQGRPFLRFCQDEDERVNYRNYI